MEPSFWHEKWQLQQIGFHLNQVNPFLVKYWPHLGLPENSEVFVPLCGKSLDMFYLAEQRHTVLGCELSLVAVKDFFTDNDIVYQESRINDHAVFSAEQVTLYQGDIFTLPSQLTSSISGFYDRAALIAWPEEMRQQYVHTLAALVPADVSGLLITLDYPQETLKGPPFAVSPTWIETYLTAYFTVELLECADVLADNSRFVYKQVPWLNEAVYKLTRKS
ncbi:thiopurine S-methyltransferase [Shewanella sp. SG44-6]|uniref:thiopurine S-methyltransferase n=1 Tax=Shewanella sp. SG44-6 TaxID=2760959 RepID=UPI0016047CD9|nr:thiopurine S-methyltransferase [Shewanella sp. SG44-6]MBB1389005.1 thiopurine S-methyltransferase [Shewanella sp. SG44-6]